MQEIAMSILDIAYNSIRANASLIKILIHDSNNLNIINIQIIDNGKGMEPVSYTHLDVYKRQPFITVSTDGSGSIPSNNSTSIPASFK